MSHASRSPVDLIQYALHLPQPFIADPLDLKFRHGGLAKRSHRQFVLDPLFSPGIFLGFTTNRSLSPPCHTPILHAAGYRPADYSLGRSVPPI